MRKLKTVVLLGVALTAAGAALLLNTAAGPSAPKQPIAYSHRLHVSDPNGPQLECTSCHQHAEESRYATIPNATDVCMSCHETEKADSPEIQKLAGYSARGEQPPWKRVYWFEPSADVHFTHKPHIKAGIACTDCHGNVPQMESARREVNQTMGWCISCHRERQVSNDCYICHR
ncbi:MAG TPA: cytochrome c3 family protein [Blastocatellia bacterium]|nr:cytochrome c3 family protein [Blastocatellia bacterium]